MVGENDREQIRNRASDEKIGSPSSLKRGRNVDEQVAREGSHDGILKIILLCLH